MRCIEVGVSYDDENVKCDLKTPRWMYVQGPPGSGKTLVLLEMAIRCARLGLTVLIVCPIGTNV